MNTMSLDKVLEGSRAAWMRARRDGANPNREAAAARDAAIEPILRELAALSSQMVATELNHRGVNRISYKTVERARRRLGLPAPNTRGERIKAALAAANRQPRRRCTHARTQPCLPR